jgi:hypothetical protein
VKTYNVETSNLTFFNKNVTSLASSSGLTFSHSTFYCWRYDKLPQTVIRRFKFRQFYPIPATWRPQSLFSQNELSCVRVWGLIMQICNFLKTITKIRFCLKLICLALRLNLHGFDLFPTVVYLVANFSRRDSWFSLKHSNIPLSEIKDFVLFTMKYDEMVIAKLVLYWTT